MTPREFLSDESGVVSVDWIVLTAVLVGTGLSVTNVVRTGLDDVSEDIEALTGAHEIEPVFR